MIQSRNVLVLKTISINLTILMTDRSLLLSLSCLVYYIILCILLPIWYNRLRRRNKKRKLCFGYRASINLTTDHALPTKDIDFPTFKFFPVPCVASHDNSWIDRQTPFGSFIDHVFFNGKISRIPLTVSTYHTF